MPIYHASARFETKMDGLKCIYDNDLNSLFNFQLDADGFTRLGPFRTPKQEDQVVQSLVRRDKTTGRKIMFFTPVRFNRLKGGVLKSPGSVWLISFIHM
jgi:hypothetical protein